MIGAIDIIIILTLLGLATRFESPERAKQSNLVSKILSIVLQIKAKLTFTIEIVLLSQIFTNTFSNGTTRILMYSGTVICLITASFIKFSMDFLLNIRVRLIDEVPWCAHKNATPLVNTTFKILNGVCLAVAVPQASAIVLLLVSALNIGLYLYFQPYHNQKVVYIDSFFMTVIFAQYFHFTIVIMDTGSRLSESITLMLFFVGFVVPALSLYLMRYRQHQLQSRLLLDQHHVEALKSETDFEKALTIFI